MYKRQVVADALPFPPLLPLVPAGAPDARAVLALLFVKALYYLAPLSFALYAGVLGVRWLRRRVAPAPGAFFLLLLGSAGLVQVVARSDIPHLLQAIGLVYFVWAIAGARARPCGGSARLVAAPALAILVPAALTLGTALFAASAAYFASYARVGLYDDEGYLLEGVTRLLDGQGIYRDFHHT